MGFYKQEGNDTLLYKSSDGDMTHKQIDTVFKALKIYRGIKEIDDNLPLFAICEHRTVNGKDFEMCHLTKKYNLEDAKKDDDGAVVYVGGYGGIGYKTKKGVINDTVSIYKTVEQAIKYFTNDNIEVVTMTVTMEVQKGTSPEEIKRLVKNRCTYGKMRRVNVVLDE